MNKIHIYFVILNILFLGYVQSQELAPVKENIVTAAKAKSVWPRSGLIIPQLENIPPMDGTLHPKIWAKASLVELQYPKNSSEVVKPETRFHVGHREGVLYLMLEFDWEGENEPVAKAKKPEDAIWADDNCEILLANPNDLDHSYQFIFNLSGVHAANRIDFNNIGNRVALTSIIDYSWKVQCHKQGNTYFAEIAIPLRKEIGISGKIGEVIRCNFSCNRTNSKIPESNWTSIKGQRSCRTDFFGMGVFTGIDQSAIVSKSLSIEKESDLILLDDVPSSSVLRGKSAEWILQMPLDNKIKMENNSNWVAILKNDEDKILIENEILINEWPCKISLNTLSLPIGSFWLDLKSKAEKQVRFHLPISVQNWIYIDAFDESVSSIKGKSVSELFPRTAGRTAIQLFEKSKLSMKATGRFFYLEFPLFFQTPGPFYSTLEETRIRFHIDGGDWQEINVIASELEIPLAENLPEISHEIEIECLTNNCRIYGMRVSNVPLTRVHGRILTTNYSELLTDVRAQFLVGNKIVRDLTVRNPLDGNFLVFGLTLNKYKLRLKAAGWQAIEKDFNLLKDGEQIELGTLFLKRELRFGDRREIPGPTYGRSICASPGESFSTLFSSWINDGPKEVFLVSEYRRISLPFSQFKKINLGQFSGVASGTFAVPINTPFDMYDMEFVFEKKSKGKINKWTETHSQAVCVREPIGESFFIAGCGHMNTWGQKNSEYLAKTAELAQLAGARMLLIANEVNAAYVSGALSNLHIPYAVINGNHTMAHWDDFYPKDYCIDDGPMRVVAHGGFSFESWSEADRLFGERPDATCRILLSYEPFAPFELLKKHSVSLIFDGHSEITKEAAGNFTEGTMQFRAPTQDSIRWIPMTRKGLPKIISNKKDVPILIVSRDSLPKLRTEFSTPNDGSVGVQSVKVINEFEIEFPSARLRFVLPKQKYTLENAKSIQTFDADNGKVTLIDVEFLVPAKGSIIIKVSPEK